MHIHRGGAYKLISRIGVVVSVIILYYYVRWYEVRRNGQTAQVPEVYKIW